MWTALVTLLLLASTIGIHYEALRFTSARLTHLRLQPRLRITVMLSVALISHLVQTFIYAVAFMLLEEIGGFGSIDGGVDQHTFGDFFYFSITSYTTLGIGDLYPMGSMRIISGVEALNGLVMVGWTASMTYLYMEKFWHLRTGAPRKRR
ncbi:potassium channel family protein [Sphingomicrobium aestuariivivum]|uniref:potassium channel family protein n=1 Tax=Sphingomicrobium aestuariivivum TaxID=1582356 RepID=UPI001FD6FF69|nr:potassium channel family protein [Sphingomicrobium aestuariivivum]MCJ8192042.1 potassium channel family protein [Sphingomicrobium aestuariivivum]